MPKINTSATPLGGALQDIFDRSVFSNGADDRSLDASIEASDAVVKAIPGPAGQIVSTYADRRHISILIASTFAAFSACLPNVRGLYRDVWYSATIFYAIIAPAGSNKGLIRRALAAIRPLDRRLQEEAAAKLHALKQEGKPVEGIEPIGLILPGDISEAGAVQALAYADRPLVMVESEMDSVSGSKSQDWRVSGSILRKAGEHEPVNKVRQGYAFFTERPELATMFAGTRDQLGRLIPNAEDGLLSRFLFSSGVSVPEWISPRPRQGASNIDKEIQSAGEKIDRLHAALSASDKLLLFSPETRHWDLIDIIYSDIKQRVRHVGYGASVDSLVHRNGVNAFRLAMICTVMSRLEEVISEMPDVLVPTDADIELGLALALIALDNGLRLHGLLPGTSNRAETTSADMHDFLDVLPHEFSRAAAIDIGRSLGSQDRTTDGRLRTMLADGLLEKVRHGFYRKNLPKVEPPYDPDNEPF